jgi:hypothetical protein
MVDLTNPSPLVMTHFELVAFVSAMIAVVIAAGCDWLARARAAGASRATSRPPQPGNPDP